MQNTAFSALIFICYLSIWNQCLSQIETHPHTHIAEMVSHWESTGLDGLFEFKQNDADKNIVANIAVFLKLQVEVKSQQQQKDSEGLAVIF